jgi:hypothetical protein
MDSPLIERIVSNDTLLAIIIRDGFEPDRTTFLTPDSWPQQLGFVVYPAGGVISRHVNLPFDRHLVGMAEVLLVKRGRCEVDIYDDRRQLTATREVAAGDLLILVAGGHGFRMIEHTVFIEVKQGPYIGPDEKERF